MSCHVNMAPNSATQVWEDQDLISNVELYTHDRKMVKSAPALTLCYLDLLLESQLYDKVIFYKSSNDKVVPDSVLRIRVEWIFYEKI